jgi:hypothetical protein
MQRDFDLIQDLMIQNNLLDHRLDYKDYVNDRFAMKAAAMMPWAFEPGQF